MKVEKKSGTVVHGERTRGNRQKLNQGKFELNNRKNSFTMRTIEERTGCLERWCSLHSQGFSRAGAGQGKGMNDQT